jgi:hypothetical protein
MRGLVDRLEEQSKSLGLEVRGDAGQPAILALGDNVWETPFVLPETLHSSDPVRGMVLGRLFDFLLPGAIESYLNPGVVIPDIEKIQERALSFFGPQIYKDLLLTSALYTLALAFSISNTLMGTMESKNQGPLH